MNAEFRGARSASEVAAAYDLAARVFGPSYFESRASKDRILATEPPADLRDVVVAVRDGEIIGIVRIVDREVQLGDAIVPIGGITSVAIRPDARGTGCGSRIMEAALDRSRARGDVLSIAFARRAVDGFYWGLGYVGLGAFPRITFTRGEAAAAPGRVVRGIRLDLANAYQQAYDHTYAAQPLRFVRSAAWWQSLPARAAWLTTDAVVSLFDGGALIGYWIVDDGVIIEAASVPGRLDDLAAAVQAESGESFTVALSPTQPLAVSLARLNHTASVRRAWNGGHIVRVLDRDAMLRGLGSRVTTVERAVWNAVAVDQHNDSRRALMAAALGSLTPAPVWSKLDEF